MYIHTFLFGMTDTVNFQNIDLLPGTHIYSIEIIRVGYYKSLDIFIIWFMQQYVCSNCCFTEIIGIIFLLVGFRM
jgi:hypothetical protein